MSKKINPNLLQLRLIKRKQVQQILALTASFAVLMSGCGGNESQQVSRRASELDDSGVNAANANEEVKAVFYENIEQCETDLQKQEKEYQILLKAHNSGELSNKPTPPAMKQESCGAQIQAAQEEHTRSAPVYNSRSDCEADGIRCEPTPTGYYQSGYRPVFGGAYFYPYGINRSYIYVYRSGTRHRVYSPRTVYRSVNSNRVVTPFGRTVNKSTPGRVKVPRHTSVPAPQRPKGTAARGTIKGRGSRGFGSTFKSTGRGGK